MMRHIYLLRISVIGAIYISCGYPQTKPANTEDTPEKAAVTLPKDNDSVLILEENENTTVSHIEKTISTTDDGITEKTVAKSTMKKEIEVKEISTVEHTNKTITKAAYALNHDSWNSLLQKYVDAKGNVNYSAFKANVDQLDTYLSILAENAPQSAWSKNKKLAYYINLYNAATVKLIVDNYPTKSIKDIPRRWKKTWIKVGTETTSLNDIEHKVLRKMNEPRIHFAINCASFSCPKLLNVAFTEANMETLLEKATKEFINDPTRNKFGPKKAELSKIFSWYKGDFTDNGGLLDYIDPYLQNPLPKGIDIDYLDYDWSLNEAK